MLQGLLVSKEFGDFKSKIMPSGISLIYSETNFLFLTAIKIIMPKIDTFYTLQYLIVYKIKLN